MKTEEKRKAGATFAMFALTAIAALLINQASVKANGSTPDTSKKVYNITTYGNLSTADSPIYVLNGKKISKAEFDKLDTQDVINVSWVSAENAAKVLDNLKSESSVLFVTTTNSDEGKKLLARINRLPHNRAFIAGAGRHGTYNRGNDVTAYVAGSNSEGNYAVMSARRGTPIASGNIGSVMVKGYKSKAHTTNITGSGMSYALADGDGENDVVALVDGKPITGRAIDHLNEKLIIINNKEATTDDLKKLSAFDIEKINFKNDDYTRHQYGNKAKKGVVYIYTKKAKQ